MLRCRDNSIYTGYTTDIEKRVKVHNNGKGAKYTRNRRPVELVYFEQFETKSEALKREIQLKKYSHMQKENIINTPKRDGGFWGSF